MYRLNHFVPLVMICPYNDYGGLKSKLKLKGEKTFQENVKKFMPKEDNWFDDPDLEGYNEEGTMNENVLHAQNELEVSIQEEQEEEENGNSRKKEPKKGNYEQI